MLQGWIVHNSQSLQYRSPFGAVSCNRQITIRASFSPEFEPQTVTLRLWQDGEGESIIVMKKLDAGGCSTWFEAKLATPATPGVIWYYFVITHNCCVYYYGNNSAQSGGAGQFYSQQPPSFQITVYKEGFSTPAWFKQAVMYQIFPDRFYNGQLDGRVLEPKKGSLIHSHWDNTPYYVRDVDTKRIVAYDFFGGNLAGVIAKLPYLKELGITVIYFNPIFESPSNHRYDTADYHKVDPMLGDNEMLAQLCAKAKEYGIAIILDGVFSHTGSDSIYFNREGRYPGEGAYQTRHSPYYSWYKFSDYPNGYESWWGIDTLPNVDETNPSYIDFIIEGKTSVIKHWSQHGIKGWRLDVVDELPDIFVKKFAKVLKETDPEAVLIGEVWEDASHKVSYGEMRDYLGGEELDSVMNYPFRQILLDFALGLKSAEQTQAALMSLYENYPLEHFYSNMNLLGTHDVPRILTLLGNPPAADTMSISAQAAYRLNPEQKQLAILRLKLLSLWQMTFPGVPSIYYGDEAEAEGFKDPFNRGTYPWGRENTELLEWYKKIITLRHQYAALKTGEWLPLYAQGDVYAYIRRITNGRDVFGQPNTDNVFIVIFNRSTERSINLDLEVRPWCKGTLVDILQNKAEIPVAGGRISLKLPPLAGKVLLQKEQPAFERSAGILMHPTSLPSKYGIGDTGREAIEFINFLYKSKQKLWQILPLNPVGYGQSPYQCLSAMAGNHLLISLGKLVREKLLTPDEVRDCPKFNQDSVDFDSVQKYKESKLQLAYRRFASNGQPAAYQKFVTANSDWLPDYALYMALRSHFGGTAWNNWPLKVAVRDETALAEYRSLLADDIGYHLFAQYLFFSQWKELKSYANQWGIKIIGDLPLFVSHDSSDVWAHPDLFQLDRQGRPAKIAGVPPDYFSATGQVWGNPHYNWKAMAKDNYSWWKLRIEKLLELTDIIRVDHFRGFEAHWEIPAGEKTAVNGKWVKGPGADFFLAMERQFGKLPFIAEDLGVITPAVDDLKDMFNYPGMKVLHFSLYLNDYGVCIPFSCDKNTAVYTGTHDNDTTLGWYKELLQIEPERAECLAGEIGLAAGDVTNIAWRLIEFAYASNANTAVIPMQDVLGLDSEARMNRPGTVGGNWQWRCRRESMTAELAAKLADLANKYNR